MTTTLNVYGASAGGGAGVDSFNGRVGVVVSVLGDYLTSQVTNDSGVAGATASAALDTLNTAIAALTAAIAALDSDDIANNSGVAGATVTNALDALDAADAALLAALSALDSSDIANVSTVAGATVTDALNTIQSALTALNIGEVYMAPQLNGAYSATVNYRVRSLGGNAAFEFNSPIPLDFGSLVSLVAIGAPEGSAISTPNTVALDSDYGAVGEGVETHSESDTLVDFTGGVGADEWFAMDISSVATLLSAGDNFGCMIDQNGFGTTVNYLWLRLRYNRA